MNSSPTRAVPKQEIHSTQKEHIDLGIWNRIITVHKQIVDSQFLTQFDVFSIPIRLSINGQSTYQTCFGGFINLMLIAFCLGLTSVIFYPNGLQFNSSVVKTEILKDYGDTGQTVFDHVTQLAGINGYFVANNSLTSVTNYATFHAYQVYGDDHQIVSLEMSTTDCESGFEICFKQTDVNRHTKIYGSPISDDRASIYIEIIWCDSTNSSCPASTIYKLGISFCNLKQDKGGQLTQYYTQDIISISDTVFSFEVKREFFTTNNNFFGHISNVFAFTLETYQIETPYQSKTAYISSSSVIKTNTDLSNRKSCQIVLATIQKTSIISEEFDDFGQTILFFLSVKQTLYFLIFLIFIKQYNKNSGHLELADSLYYIDNPATKKKYNFKSGYEVFIACMLHKHFVSQICDFFLQKCGRTMYDFYPHKTVHVIHLIQKAEELLEQDNFFGTLNDLMMGKKEVSKKVPFVLPKNEEYFDESVEIEYFSLRASDSEKDRMQKEIKLQAFRQFCEANDFNSPSRKNNCYRILTDRKMGSLLMHDMQKQFKGFVNNVRMQNSENSGFQTETLSESNSEEIKIEIHEVSSFKLSGAAFSNRKKMPKSTLKIEGEIFT